LTREARLSTRTWQDGWDGCFTSRPRLPSTCVRHGGTDWQAVRKSAAGLLFYSPVSEYHLQSLSNEALLDVLRTIQVGRSLAGV
jgi:hypothetical protein